MPKTSLIALLLNFTLQGSVQYITINDIPTEELKNNLFNAIKLNDPVKVNKTLSEFKNHSSYQIIFINRFFRTIFTVKQSSLKNDYSPLSYALFLQRDPAIIRSLINNTTHFEEQFIDILLEGSNLHRTWLQVPESKWQENLEYLKDMVYLLIDAGVHCTQKTLDIATFETPEWFPSRDSLLSKIKINILNDNITPLMKAILEKYFNPKTKYTKIVSLIKRGASVKTEETSRIETRGQTALHYACQWLPDDDNDIVKLLISHGADVNKKDFKGNTPLHYVTTAKAARALIAAGANVDAKNMYHQTALHLARSLKIAQILITAGSNVNKQDYIKKTPLYYARTKKIEKLLISRGANY